MIIIILLVVLIALVVVVLISVLIKNPKNSISLLQLKENIDSQFKISRESLFEVTKGLETLKVEGKNTKDSMESYVKNINSLQNILQNPKHRGNLGEFLLEKTLSDFLAPKQYKLQYQLEGGVVDAVINVENNTLIPIDAKFSKNITSNWLSCRIMVTKKCYKKELKNDWELDETSQYIQPLNKTGRYCFASKHCKICLQIYGWGFLIEWCKENRIKSCCCLITSFCMVCH